MLTSSSPQLSAANVYVDHYMLHGAAMRRLGQTIGYIAKAIAWPHTHGIRHKDLKLAQILLSFNGLWLADFGWSKVVSDLTGSATSGGDIITIKYHAPERAARERCGKAEDFFALGCVFLEIGTRLLEGVVDSPMPELPALDLPWAQKKWSFYANLQHIDTWIRPFFIDSDRQLPLLGLLIARMMSFNPEDRPKIDNIVKNLAGNHFHHSRAGLLANFFHDCCAPSWDTDEHPNKSVPDQGGDQSTTTFTEEMEGLIWEDIDTQAAADLQQAWSGPESNLGAIVLETSYTSKAQKRIIMDMSSGNYNYRVPQKQPLSNR